MKDLKQLIARWEKELSLQSELISEDEQAFIDDTITSLKQFGKLTDALRTFALTSNSIMLGKNLD